LPGALPRHAHPSCVRIERRRSDFQRDVRVTPFTGSCCCCCCCLHWVGAAAGGIVGARLGWQSAEKKMDAPLPPSARAALKKGLWVGIGLSSLAVVLGVALATSVHGSFPTGVEYYLLALAFVPSVVFLPLGVPMIAAAHGLRAKMLRAFLGDLKKLPAKDGSDKSMSLYRAKLTPPPKTRDPVVQFSVFCPHCWTDLEQSMHLDACPECSAPIDHPVISGPDYGVKVAWRAALMSFGLSTAGTALGYLIMLALSLLF
jgi:hypothetical protein